MHGGTKAAMVAHTQQVDLTRFCLFSHSEQRNLISYREVLRIN